MQIAQRASDTSVNLRLDRIASHQTIGISLDECTSEDEINTSGELFWALTESHFLYRRSQANRIWTDKVCHSLWPSAQDAIPDPSCF